ncbi:MAG: caspase family protein [Pseudomonadales bacterium]|nr:caspase family protein [Pseudomonadales bacterium]
MRFAVFVLMVGCLALNAAASDRVALVIGNADYPGAPLENPVRDAKAMSTKLRSLGFHVVEVENASLKNMQHGLVDFLQEIDQGATALVFYAGHGIQANGRNYLMPIDASMDSETTLRFDAMELNDVLEELERSGASINIVILDACRNNPFERKTRGSSRGLAVVDAAVGTLIAYATAPGSVASDGNGEHGLYTGALLKALDEPGLEVEAVFKNVRNQVAKASNNQQIPWESSSLTGNFVFNQSGPRTDSQATATAQMVASSDKESLLWTSIEKSENPADFRDYLDQYPNGVFAGVATRRIKALDEDSVGGSCDDLSGKYYISVEGKPCADAMDLLKTGVDTYSMHYHVCGPVGLVSNIKGSGQFRDGVYTSSWFTPPCGGTTAFEFDRDDACQTATGKLVKRTGVPILCRAFVSTEAVLNVAREAKEAGKTADSK